MPKPRWIFLYGLTIVVPFIAARAEYLNVRAGHYLPRREPLDMGKWRQSSIVNEARWREFCGPRELDGTPAQRELTAEEQQRMRLEVSRARDNNALRDWTATAGLLQYLLIPTLFFAATIVLITDQSAREWRAFLPIVLVLILASALLWYREYFPSLGS